MLRVIYGSVFLCIATIHSSGVSHADVVLWNEGVNGDLSNNPAAPNPFVVLFGANSVIGNVGGADSQDWITLNVPTGRRISQLVLAAYASSDVQGFTGVQAGTSFIGSTGNPASYLGYAHFGTAAVNGNLPPTNLVGADILPIMGDTTIAFGSQGFLPPLGPGNYTFLIQQLGASTNYTFNYVVTAVPEPSSVALCGIAATAGLVWLRRRMARRSAS